MKKQLTVFSGNDGHGDDNRYNDDSHEISGNFGQEGEDDHGAQSARIDRRCCVGRDGECKQDHDELGCMTFSQYREQEVGYTDFRTGSPGGNSRSSELFEAFIDLVFT